MYGGYIKWHYSSGVLSFLGGKVAGVWTRSLTSIWCWG